MKKIIICILLLFGFGITPLSSLQAQDPLKAPPIRTDLPPNYQDDARKFQGIPSLCATGNDRLWATWYSGGITENGENYVLLITSDDRGKTWSKPLFAIDPPGDVRAFDSSIWQDPDGKLWLFWAQGESVSREICPMTIWDGRTGVWCICTDNPQDGENAKWTKPRRLCDGIMMCKPIVDSQKRWLLPVAIWHFNSKYKTSIPIGANIFVSTDKGKNFSFLGGAKAPLKDSIFPEHNLIEKKDGSLWILSRMNYGIGESISRDGGKTFPDLIPSSILKHTSSRFFITRLQSGNLLLVKNGPIDKKVGRSQMTAHLSEDDGKTWTSSLILDERGNVSYPDGAQTADGTIYIVYDRERYSDKEILVARFNENDVKAGKIASSDSQLKIIANKAKGKIEKKNTVKKGTQSADPEIWKKEYEKRIKDTIAARKKQKKDFAKDVLYTKPDYIVFIPKVEPEKLGDCYNDHFQVFENSKGEMFALTCQATCEGAQDQHVTFFRSSDRGKTWSDPKVIAGPKTLNDNVPIASWAFPMVSRSDRIYVIYDQYVPGKVSTNRQHTGIMVGIFSDDNGETWSKPGQIPMPRSCYDSPDTSIPPEWVVWQKPLRLAQGGKYLVGVSRHVAPEFHKRFRTVTQFIRFENIDKDPAPEKIKATWLLPNEKALSIGVYCEEASIVKLPDGRLFALMRTGTGSPVWSVSSDDGENWTDPKKLLDKNGKPFLHPMSPCPLYDWKGENAASGYYFCFIHNTFDFKSKSPWQKRGPLYLLAGRYQANADQPIQFDDPRLFVDREFNQSFYTSTTQIDGKTVLWYNDQKFYLLGKVIDSSWFEPKK